jgi:hypothetical protein
MPLYGVEVKTLPDTRTPDEAKSAACGATMSALKP